MKLNKHSIFFVAFLSLGACKGKTENMTVDQQSDIGITYREGKGLDVSEATKNAIQIKTAEVEEGVFTPQLQKSGTIIESGNIVSKEHHDKSTLRISVMLTSEEAQNIERTQKISLQGFSGKGAIISLSDPDYFSGGGREVIVEFKYLNPITNGELPFVLFELSGYEASAMIPKSALLKTSSGTFVYVPNGRYFFRTAIKIGKENRDAIEVLEGLYPGDEVVSSPVMTLWLAELQAIKGGVSCADGH